MRTGYVTTGFDRVALTRAIGLITNVTDLDTKFCFFIDGLDEYEGFDRDIAATIKTLASLPSVKLCVASRPHNAFIDAFGGNPEQMLSVHEHTGSDIHQYVTDVLERNSAFVLRTQQDPAEYQNLVEYIRKEANGVFLWVYLVVANILDGMENADRMLDLQRKLKMIPTDLKALFTHILNNVEADYHEQQAQMLQIACQTEQPLSLIGYSFLDEGDPDFAPNYPVGPISPEEVLDRYDCMEKRVVSRCKLLLEVVERPDDHPHLPKYVTFLHRTVRDYLREAEAQEILASRLKGPFDPRQRLCDLLLAQIKCIPVPESLQKWKINHRLMYQLLLVAKEVESSSNVPPALHLDSLKATIDQIGGPDFNWWQTNGYCNTVERPVDNLTCFLQMIVRSSLPAYLRWRLYECNDMANLDLAQKSSLLTRSVYRNDRDLVAVDMRWSAAIVEELLKAGADPDLLDEESDLRPWHAFISSALRLSKLKASGSIDLVTVDCDLDKEMFLIYEQFIFAAADLNVACEADRAEPAGGWKPNEQRQMLLMIEECIERTVTPTDATYLLGLIQRRRKELERSRLSVFLRWFLPASKPPAVYTSILHQTAPPSRVEKSRSGVNRPICGIILFLLVVLFFKWTQSVKIVARRLDFR